jgi:hypothetical protein
MHSRSCDERQHTFNDVGDAGYEGALRDPRARPGNHSIGAFEAARRRILGADDRYQVSITGCVEPVVISRRLSIRLLSDDLLLLRERAKARDVPTSTYVSLLVRSHRRLVTPLPTAELIALKRSVAEMSAIGRSLNQIARAFNQGERSDGASKADLYTLLRALNGLRVHIKTLINANLASWRNGYEKANR